MSTEVINLIQACQWGASHFLIISNNVFSPLLYYTYFGAAIPTLIIGLFVYFNNKKSLENKLLLLTVLSFVFWIFCNLVTWATEIPSYTMFFWTLLIIVEPFVYFFAFYFSYVFLNRKDFSFKQKIAYSLPLLPTLVFSSTKLGLLGYDLSNCDRAAQEGVLTSYGYILEVIYLLGILLSAFSIINNSLYRKNKKVNIIFTIGILFFLFSFSLGNIAEIFGDNWYVGQYGLLGAPIFSGLLAYLIVKFKTFNVRLIGAQAIVVGLVVLIGSKLLTSENSLSRIVTILTLVAISVFGYFLVKSVKKEIEARERIELLADQLEHANERLQILDQQKTQFVSIASHQLRAPLTPIKGYLSMILEGDYGPVEGELRNIIQRVLESANNLVTIVGDFLDVSRIEQGRMTYEWSDFDVKPLVETLEAELRPVAEKHGLEFGVSIENDKEFMIHGDKNKIKQVFTNLIDNSIKYTPKGKVWIELSHPTPEIVRFEVNDTGIGINAETIPKLFEKFTRAAGANDVNVIGTGLGLYVAKEMIRAHDGAKIWAESDGKGKGSTFVVELKAL